MRITIKRAVVEGVDGIGWCEGTLFEDRGRQFCLTHLSDAAEWCAIELSTGRALWGTLYDPHAKHPIKGKSELKDLIIGRPDSSWETGMELSKKENEKLGYPYPLNEAIKKIKHPL